jgi:hypothetical protein
MSPFENASRGPVDLQEFLLSPFCGTAILQKVATVGCFDTEAGSGIAIRLPVEETIGLMANQGNLTEKRGSTVSKLSLLCDEVGFATSMAKDDC